MRRLKFDPRFETALRSGQKTMTIRRSTRIKEGDRIQFRIDGRLIAEAHCETVMPISIGSSGMIKDGSGEIDWVETFAEMCGFDSHKSQVWYIRQLYGLPFKGVLIIW